MTVLTEAPPLRTVAIAQAFAVPVELVVVPDEHFAAYVRGEGGDPTLVVRVACPCCGSDARTFDTETRRFGCLFCTYTSDERNA